MRAERRNSGALARAKLAGMKVGKHSVIQILLTRIGRGRMDADNLAGSGKHVQDGICDALGIDDGSERVRFSYAQEIGVRWGVRVEIEVHGA